jgi:polysaccharide export outer membrane protein
MNSNKESIWIASMTSILACLFLSSMLYGQNAGGSGQVATPSKAEAQTAATQDSDARGHDNSYVIGNDDMLAVNVWKEAEISRSVPVRSDGKISLPLAGELQAAGRTPFKLEQDITERLKNYISEPEVTVIVQQINSQKFNIMGQVVKPGSYPLASAATVLDAIAVAGGFRDFAKKKSIYVLRQNPDGTQTRIPFNYKEVIKGQNPSQNEKLQPRDTVVVP